MVGYVDPLTGVVREVTSEGVSVSSGGKDMLACVREALDDLRWLLPPRLNQLPDEKLLWLVEWSIKVALEHRKGEPPGGPSRERQPASGLAGDGEADVQEIPF